MERGRSLLLNAVTIVAIALPLDPAAAGIALAVLVALRLHEQTGRENVRCRLLAVGSNGTVWKWCPRTLRFTYVSMQAEQLLGFARRLVPARLLPRAHPSRRLKEVPVGRPRMRHRFGRWRVRHMVWVCDAITVGRVCAKPGRLRGVMVDMSARRTVGNSPDVPHCHGRACQPRSESAS